MGAAQRIGDDAAVTGRDAGPAQMLADIDAAFRRCQYSTGLAAPDVRVRAAMAAVPRELFVPPARHREAYADAAVAIACGQTVSQPFIVALMTTLLAPSPDDVVLEVGTGSGYQAAVLSRLCRRVLTIERWPALAASAAARLRDLGCANVEVRCGDGSRGWPEAAPFAGIVVTCAAGAEPPALVEQLRAPGRLVLPVGEQGTTQQLLLVARDGAGGLQRRGVLPVRFVPLVTGAPPAP
jgi:protein-L-isoaspartate(D-aspartate) O-methyltransferase